MSSEWDSSARLRRIQIESGKDLTFSRVFLPVYISLVKSLQPSSILEVGIGTGNLALELSPLTNRYVGIEPSNAMFGEARDVLKGTEVKLVRATMEEFEDNERFELILSHMCLQAVQNYVDFLRSMARLLANGGSYLLSIPHPAFFNDYKKMIAAENFSYMLESSALVDFSISLDPLNKISQISYFHRPLSKYFSAFAKAGLSVNYLKEIYPPIEIQSLYGNPWQTPRYLLLGGQILAGVEIAASIKPSRNDCLNLNTKFEGC
jgi:ubiquinone/menaquinone biosynthesis C-methylase UbiE